MAQEQVQQSKNLAPIVVAINKSQIALVVATVTIIFAIVGFVINYVERRLVPDRPQIPQEITIAIIQQAEILRVLNERSDKDHDMLVGRTEIIKITSENAAANNQMLRSLSQSMAEETRVFQKFGFWLDRQMAKEK